MFSQGGALNDGTSLPGPSTRKQSYRLPAILLLLVLVLLFSSSTMPFLNRRYWFYFLVIPSLIGVFGRRLFLRRHSGIQSLSARGFESRPNRRTGSRL